MGEPEYLSDKQVQRLHAASGLEPRPMRYHYVKNTIGIEFTLMPRIRGRGIPSIEAPQQTSSGSAPASIHLWRNSGMQNASASFPAKLHIGLGVRMDNATDPAADSPSHTHGPGLVHGPGRMHGGDPACAVELLPA